VWTWQFCQVLRVFDESLEEVKAELKVVTFEARQNRQQGIKSHAELCQALSSIEETRCYSSELQKEFSDRFAECYAEAKNSKKGAEEVKNAEALILYFPEVTWPPADTFEDTLRSTLHLDQTSQMRLQPRDPGVIVEVPGSPARVKELHREWADRAGEGMVDELKVCLAWRVSTNDGDVSTTAPDLFRMLQTLRYEVAEERKDFAEVNDRLLAEQHEQGHWLNELQQRQEATLENLNSVAEEWCCGLGQLRVALSQDAESSQRQEDRLGLDCSVQESLESATIRNLRCEVLEAKQHLSEVVSEEASAQFNQIMEVSRSNEAELDLVRRQLKEMVQDRVELRRQLLELCGQRRLDTK